MFVPTILALILMALVAAWLMDDPLCPACWEPLEEVHEEMDWMCVNCGEAYLNDELEVSDG